MFDCCQETDGAIALIITTRERAAAMPQPAVGIAAVAGAGLFEQEIASDHYRPDLAVMDSSVVLARRLFDDAGFRRDEIDLAMIYDAFSPILLMQLEALGFCGFGEAKDFIGEGNLAAERVAPLQHERRLDRRGLHPRLEPGHRSRPPDPRHCGQPATDRRPRVGVGEPDWRDPHADVTTHLRA